MARHMAQAVKHLPSKNYSPEFKPQNHKTKKEKRIIFLIGCLNFIHFTLSYNDASIGAYFCIDIMTSTEQLLYFHRVKDKNSKMCIL
jgi:hypothetical protein